MRTAFHRYYAKYRSTCNLSQNTSGMLDLRRSSPNIDQISRRNEISRICQLCIGIDIYRRIDPFTTIRFTLPLLQIRAGKIQRSQFRTTSYGHSNNRPTILYRHGFDLRTFIQFDTLRPNLRTGRTCHHQGESRQALKTVAIDCRQTFHQRNINRSQIDITNSQFVSSKDSNPDTSSVFKFRKYSIPAKDFTSAALSALSSKSVPDQLPPA